MKIDFSGVKEPEAVPAGTYEVTFTGHKNREGRESKKPYISLEFTISEGDHAGRKLYRNASLSENALWWLKNTLITLGADPDVFGDPELDLDELLPELYGSEAIVETNLQESTQEGRGPRVEVARVRDKVFS